MQQHTSVTKALGVKVHQEPRACLCMHSTWRRVCAKFDIRFSQKFPCIAAFVGSLRLHLTLSHPDCFTACSPGRQACIYPIHDLRSSPCAYRPSGVCGVTDRKAFFRFFFCSPPTLPPSTK